MPNLAEVPTTRFDIAGDATAADPFPALRALRAQGPVVWHEVHRRWLVTTDRAVRRLACDPRTCTVEGTTVADAFGADAFIAIDDPRRHNALRNIWAEMFRVPTLERSRPLVEDIVARLLAPLRARLEDGETVDLVASLCRPLPTMVIAAMMGVDEDMHSDVVRWSDAIAAGSSAYLDGEVGRAAIRARDEAKRGLADYLLDLMARRRVRPGDDLASLLVGAEAARTLPDDQLVQNLRQLLFAGNETTAKWLAHLFLTYGTRPDLRRALAADPSLIAAADDEVMRWANVVGTTVRRVRGGPIEVDGIRLADGDDLTLVLAAANRDPARWEDPDTLDIHRRWQPNLGFGIGLHNCLGSMLARMEAQTAVERFLEAVPDFAVVAPTRYTSLPLRGPSPVAVARNREGNRT